MKSYFILLIGISFFWGCNSHPDFVLTPVEFSQQDLALCKTGPCPTIVINYLKAEGSDAIASNINEQIQEYLVSTIHVGEDPHKLAENLVVAANKFVTVFRSDKSTFELDVNYEANLDVTESFENEHMIGLELKSYLYTGGAHGYGSVNFKNIDKKTGESLSSSDLFVNIDSITSFVEARFREKNQIPEDSAINSNGFWFEDDVFYLPNDIGFLKDGIVVLYNAYDIASYADGPIELFIPYADLTNQLSNVYFK